MTGTEQEIISAYMARLARIKQAKLSKQERQEHARRMSRTRWDKAKLRGEK